jgi:hypothetical protein
MKTLKPITLLFLLIMLALLTACGSENTPADNVVDNQQNNTNSQNQETEDQNQNQNQPANDVEETPEEVQPPFEPLPADPQPVTINTEDGRTLEGFYYPAKIPNAPVVVLMHWAPGDMNDWLAIAPWLQNRKDELAANPRAPIVVAGYNARPSTGAAWTDDSWFPPMPEEASFAVLIFNFGGYGNSIGSRATGVIDAKNAVEFAATLPEVDPEQISALGASIGADGAVDGCYLANKQGEIGACIGALSLSPGNYLTDEFTYAEAVTPLDMAGYPVWCLAAEYDGPSPEACKSAEGDHYRTFIYLHDDPHGMALVVPEFYPQDPAVELDTMQLIQEWLEEVYGLTLNEISIE